MSKYFIYKNQQNNKFFIEKEAPFGNKRVEVHKDLEYKIINSARVLNGEVVDDTLYFDIQEEAKNHVNILIQKESAKPILIETIDTENDPKDT